MKEARACESDLNKEKARLKVRLARTSKGQSLWLVSIIEYREIITGHVHEVMFDQNKESKDCGISAGPRHV